MTKQIIVTHALEDASHTFTVFKSSFAFGSFLKWSRTGCYTTQMYKPLVTLNICLFQIQNTTKENMKDDRVHLFEKKDYNIPYMTQKTF